MKAKKLTAILLAAIMVFSLSITSFAAQGDEGGTITVKKVSENTELEFYQILYIEKTVNNSKYEFVDDAYKAAFVDAIQALEDTFPDDATTAQILGFITDDDRCDSDFMAALAIVLDEQLPDTADYTEEDGTLNAAKDELTFEVNLGYYLVKDVTGYEAHDGNSIFIMMNTVDTEVTITLKTTVYTVPVKEQEVPNEIIDPNGDTVKIGDIVTFTITVEIPNYSEYEDYAFKVIDVMSKGLTFDEITSITIGTDSYDIGDLINFLPVVADDKTTMVFDFGNINETFAGYIGADLVIKYTATVNDDVEDLFETLTNDVAVLENGETIDGEGTNAYTYGFDFDKVDEYDNKLAGVEFKLYRPVRDENDEFSTDIDDYANATPLTFTQGTDGIYRYDASGNDTITTPANGYVKVVGLEAGDYVLFETKALPGYNLLDGGLKFYLGGETGGYEIGDIRNNTGIEMPGTGGIGNTLFTVVGTLILVGAGAALVVNRKRVFGK